MKSVYGGHRPECQLQLPRISDKNVKEDIVAVHCVKELANDGSFYEVLKETVKRTLGAFRLVLTTLWAATRRPKKQTVVCADALSIQHDGAKLSC
jgi:hypothetical protein